ncbi:MAG: DNA polymerase III subunit [Lachnospiraceae bacterium]|nr:DNA polymerase III subunit [Lachnospiraceae bacterium]
MTFSQIKGQDKIIERLETAIRQGNISHAYILEGEDSHTAALLAAAFSTALQCEKGGLPPCHDCLPCRQAETGNNPDTIRVTHEKPGVISVDNIREQVVNDILIKPFYSRHKIYVVPEAEKMNPQAQNALLKTLEEPPEYAVVLLLTKNAESLLPTILSRCQILRLAETEEELSSLRAEAVRLLKTTGDPRMSLVTDTIRVLKEEKENIPAFLNLMTLWYRDLLLLKSAELKEELYFRDELAFLQKEAEGSGYEALSEKLSAIEKAKEQINANVSLETVMELLYFNISQ